MLDDPPGWEAVVRIKSGDKAAGPGRGCFMFGPGNTAGEDGNHSLCPPKSQRSRAGLAW